MVKTYKRRKRNTKKQMKSGKNNSKHTLRKMKSKSKSRVTKRRQRGGMNGGAAADESKPLLSSIRGFADVENSDKALKDSQLITYASLGHLDSVRAELKNMENMNTGDINEEINSITALMAASQNGHNDVVQYLLKKGANPNIQTSSAYRNALTIAASHNQLDVMETLLTYTSTNQIKLDEGNVMNVTPLMIAVFNNNGDDKNYRIIESLLEKKADVNATDNLNKTALMKAVINGNGPVVRLLLNNRANLYDENGKTAYELAIENDKQDAIDAIEVFMHMKPGAYWGNSGSNATSSLLGKSRLRSGYNQHAASTYEPPTGN